MLKRTTHVFIVTCTIEILFLAIGGIASAVAQALPVVAVGEAKGNPDTKHERVIRYRINKGEVFYGILIDKHIRRLTNSFVEIARGRRDFSGARHALDKVKLLAPVNPSKVIFLGGPFPVMPVRWAERNAARNPWCS